ncbi:hypothetical protein B0H14DRAFT_2577630 [Mycena olivaceomarginata]|nr:hypothetical protein B0H14DRAFT_2577630 [Mycena olivaceomarginata]
MDRRTDSASSILRLVEASRQARWEQARELQLRRVAEAKAKKIAEDAEAAALDLRLQCSRVEYVERLRFGPRPPSRPLKKSSSLHLLGTNTVAASPPRRSLQSAPSVESPAPSQLPRRDRRSLQSASSRNITVNSPALKADHLDPEVRETDAIGFPCFHREPDWSEASDEDDYNPASGLPPHTAVERQPPSCCGYEAELEMKRAREQEREEQRNKVRNAMRLVTAQILEVGAGRRHRENCN